MGSQCLCAFSFSAKGCSFSFATFKTKSEHCCELTQTAKQFKTLASATRTVGFVIIKFHTAFVISLFCLSSKEVQVLLLFNSKCDLAVI